MCTACYQLLIDIVCSNTNVYTENTYKKEAWIKMTSTESSTVHVNYCLDITCNDYVICYTYSLFKVSYGTEVLKVPPGVGNV